MVIAPLVARCCFNQPTSDPEIVLEVLDHAHELDLNGASNFDLGDTSTCRRYSAEPGQCPQSLVCKNCGHAPNQTRENCEEAAP